MSIWKQLYGTTLGGWKTYGPNSVDGPGAFDSSDDGGFQTVTAETAMRLSAVWGCQHIRAETVGTLPFHLRDADKKVLRDHPLYSVLHDSPNSRQTAAEYWSLNTAHLDMYGNAVSIIKRRSDKSIISLEPADPTNSSFAYNKSGTRKTWKIGDNEFDDFEVLHLKGFSMNGEWGAPRLSIGRMILGAQLEANESAIRNFKQGLKVGGFFKVENNLDTIQLNAFHERLNQFGRPENAGKYMTLLKGMEPIAGEKFRTTPVDAQLLESRYFGIEEICRLYNTPPQLIGHSDKASSWASSLEHLHLFFRSFSIQPTVIRTEQSVSKKLLSPYDRANGIRPKFSMEGMQRADLKTRQAFYASALQNGYLNRNEVRDLEERAEIPGGEKYTVQLNMTDVNDLPETDGTDKGVKTP